MKCKRVFLSDYFHFRKDLVIDLSYPLGHPESGQPLKKVCIVGQSGTGKSLLAKTIISALSSKQDFIVQGKLGMSFVYGEAKIDISADHSTFQANLLNNEVPSSKRSFSDFLEKKYNKPLIISEENAFPFDNYHVIHINDSLFSKHWEEVLEALIHYKKELEEQKNKLVISASNPSATPEMVLKQSEEFRTWKLATYNPIEDLAENCLDIILNRFGVRVRKESLPDWSEKSEPLLFEQLNGKPVPFDALSTGTKEVIKNALPLFNLKPTRTIVVLDEPERSLYPDIQHRLVDFYLSLINDCQLIVATHSPMVASAFEPWEIVKLEFDKKGSVYREEYFEGERHVDNCFSDPRFQNWNQILETWFSMGKSGGELREEAKLKKYDLEKEINEAKSTTSNETFQELLHKYEVLNKKLGRDKNN